MRGSVAYTLYSLLLCLRGTSLSLFLSFSLSLFLSFSLLRARALSRSLARSLSLTLVRSLSVCARTPPCVYVGVHACFFHQAIDGLLPSLSRAEGILSSFSTLLHSSSMPSSHLLLSLRNT